MTDFYNQAISSLRPNSEFVTTDNVITEWLDTEETQPTEQEIQAKIIELQAKYDGEQYQRDRKKAYPSIVDQLDDIFHNGIDGWKATIQAVKDEYPKPE